MNFIVGNLAAAGMKPKGKPIGVRCPASVGERWSSAHPASISNAAVSGAAEPRTLDEPVGDREYCLICRREMMTESGHVCSSCANKKAEG